MNQPDASKKTARPSVAPPIAPPVTESIVDTDGRKWPSVKQSRFSAPWVFLYALIFLPIVPCYFGNVTELGIFYIAGYMMFVALAALVPVWWIAVSGGMEIAFGLLYLVGGGVLAASAGEGIGIDLLVMPSLITLMVAIPLSACCRRGRFIQLGQEDEWDFTEETKLNTGLLSLLAFVALAAVAFVFAEEQFACSPLFEVCLYVIIASVIAINTIVGIWAALIGELREARLRVFILVTFVICAVGSFLIFYSSYRLEGPFNSYAEMLLGFGLLFVLLVCCCAMTTTQLVLLRQNGVRYVEGSNA